ncbi:MAG: hypothetical protein NC924_00865 [Candidatus Omnitrophica bacterium]|nr:hypothetical protein [Candidatus Omnitrophota bacterium]
MKKIHVPVKGIVVGLALGAAGMVEAQAAPMALPARLSQVFFLPAAVRAADAVYDAAVALDHDIFRDMPGLGFYDWGHSRRAYEVETALRRAL